MLKIKAIGLKLFRAKEALVILGWGTSLANLAVTAVAHGVLVPQAEYYSEATTSQIGLLLFALYYAGFFGAYIVGLLLTALILDLPVITGFLSQTVEANLATGIIFTAFFPFALIVGLMGALLGAAPADL